MDPRAWSRFRKNKGAFVGAGFVVLVLGLALVGPWLAAHDPSEQFRQTLLSDDGIPRGPLEVPGHWLGADPIGRDELARLLHGGAVSMQVAIVATALAVALGVTVGVISGFLGGTFDLAAMRAVDLLLSLPFLLIAIAVNRVIDKPALWTLYLILGFLSWTTLARVTRAKTMQVRELEFVQAAYALGLSRWRVLVRHVLPNVLGPAIVLGTTLVSEMILFESAMSYLGLGVQPPRASWGSMLREGQELMTHSPRLMLYPGVLILLAVFGFNLLGEGLRDAFDPKD